MSVTNTYKETIVCIKKKEKRKKRKKDKHKWIIYVAIRLMSSVLMTVYEILKVFLNVNCV